MELAHIATLVFLSAFAASATSQSVNVSLPIAYEAKILQAVEVPGECPAFNQINATLTEIKVEIARLIQDYVTPVIQNTSVGPTVPTQSLPCCGEDAAGWTRVAYYNMTDTSYNCPGSLVLYETPKRSCGRGSSYNGCLSTSFRVNSRSYSKVCGRIIGYQVGPTTAFYGSTGNIDSRYISGVSLTYGSSPRQHIWSFVAALGHSYSYHWNCPCTSIGYTTTVTVPAFMNGNYFCETGTNTYVNDRFYPDKPLWDGEGCQDTSTCCNFNNPPWFCQNLTQPTTEDIEMRLCTNSNPAQPNDTPLELIELYIK